MQSQSSEITTVETITTCKDRVDLAELRWMILAHQQSLVTIDHPPQVRRGERSDSPVQAPHWLPAPGLSARHCLPDVQLRSHPGHALHSLQRWGREPQWSYKTYYSRLCWFHQTSCGRGCCPPRSFLSCLLLYPRGCYEVKSILHSTKLAQRPVNIFSAIIKLFGECFNT